MLPAFKKEKRKKVHRHISDATHNYIFVLLSGEAPKKLQAL